MIDIPIRRAIDPVLNHWAIHLAAFGITANQMTWFGFMIGIGGCAAIAQQWFWLGLLGIGLNRLADGLDGCLARNSRPTDLGGYLDIVLDLIFYSAVPVAFAIAEPANRFPALLLVHSFMGTGGSFLAFAIIAAKRGVETDIRQQKSFFYSTGLMEGAETIGFFGLFCLFPQAFPILAYLFAALCWLTTAIRIAVAMRAFR